MTNTDFVNPGSPTTPQRPLTRLEKALAKLALWEGAEDALATGQSYEIDGRKLTRANGEFIRERINYYQNEVDRLRAGRGCGPRRTRAVPRG